MQRKKLFYCFLSFIPPHRLTFQTFYRLKNKHSHTHTHIPTHLSNQHSPPFPNHIFFFSSPPNTHTSTLFYPYRPPSLICPYLESCSYPFSALSLPLSLFHLISICFQGFLCRILCSFHRWTVLGLMCNILEISCVDTLVAVKDMMGCLLTDNENSNSSVVQWLLRITVCLRASHTRISCTYQILSFVFKNYDEIFLLYIYTSISVCILIWLIPWWTKTKGHLK